jgi:hypothetical protein
MTKEMRSLGNLAAQSSQYHPGVDTNVMEGRPALDLRVQEGGVAFEYHLQVPLRDFPQRTFIPEFVIEWPWRDLTVFADFATHIHVADARPILTVLGGMNVLEKPEELIQKVINRPA